MSSDQSSKDILERLKNSKAYIKVFGIGGAGVNAVNNMIDSGLEGVEFFAANTDAQALASSKAENKIQLGQEITKGLGAGADPDIGYAAAQESEEQIRKALQGADMVFITAGLGGGTGTLGSSVVAEIAKEMGCLTVGVVTKPFLFEGKRRMKNAERGMIELADKVDTLITIPNQRLLSIAGRNTSLLDTFRKADDILFQAVKGISDLIFFEGLVNVDFADVRAVMAEMGMAMMGTGEASGDNRALEAAEKAVSSPLLEDISIHGARGVLINVTASTDVTLQEVNEAAELIHSEAHDDANIIWGMVIDPNIEDKVRVTVIATGFGKEMEEALERSSGASTRSAKTTLGGMEATGSLRGRSGITPTSSTTTSSPLMRAGQEAKAQPDVVRMKKLPNISSSASEEEKYEIPTFLRKQ